MFRRLSEALTRARLRDPGNRGELRVVVTARHLAVGVVVLTSALLILGGLIVKRLQEFESECGVKRQVDVTVTLEPTPQGDVIPPPQCLRQDDGTWIKDQNGNPICTESM